MMKYSMNIQKIVTDDKNHKDLTESVSNLVITKSLMSQADEIAAAHENFTTHYVVGGRIALYNLLADMLRVVNIFECDADRHMQIKAIKNRLRTEYGIKTQKNSSDTAVLVRYMTRTDRKSTHVYARVIEVAKSNGVTPEQLPSFIESQGGIERVRSLSAEGGLSNDIDDMAERISLTEEYLSCRTELPLASFEATPFLDQFGSNSAAFEYFVCSRKGDGRYHILSRLPSTSEFEKIAIKHLSQLVCADMEHARKGVADLRQRANKVIKKRFSDSEKTASKSTHQEIEASEVLRG